MYMKPPRVHRGGQDKMCEGWVKKVDLEKDWKGNAGNKQLPSTN